MVPRSRVHDSVILDALEAIAPTPFNDDVWRVTRKEREALRGASANGRWSPPGEFEVLYTSESEEGALAEIGYRLSLEPVWPSRIEHEIHCIDLHLTRTLRLVDISQLSPLGVDIARYESFDYSATQAIASAAHFLEFDGLVIPSARYECTNIVVFMEQAAENGRMEVRSSAAVDWSSWQRKRR